MRYPLAILALLAIPGCSRDPVLVSMPQDLPPAFSAAGTAESPMDWWTLFEDPGLNQAMEMAFSGNLTLAVAWDRLAQAEAIARREGAPLYPAVDVLAAGRRTRERLAGNTRHETTFLAELAASYEIDLWGRIRSARDAALYEVAAGEQDVQAAAISLSASVATVWFQLAEALEQARLLDQQSSTNSQTLDLVGERFRQGKVQAADVLRQQQLLESTRGLRTLADQRAGVFRHQLAVLLGRSPGTDPGLPEPAMADLPSLPSTGVPADLMQRRPDVRSAFLTVQSQNRLLASAIAEQYPRISLSASLETGEGNVRDLFDDWFASLAANLVHPLFDAGERRAEVDRNRALVSESLHVYHRTILEAVQDVEDALVLESHQERYLESLRKQLDTADSVIERTRTSYINGQLDYLRVLDALTSRQSLERQYLSALLDRLEYRIQLYRALGGAAPVLRPPLETVSTSVSPTEAVPAGAPPSEKGSSDGSI